MEFGEKEVEELHAQLLREVQSKKKNYAAIKEIQQNTFDFRRKDIEQMSDKSVVSEIISHYPFLQVHECTVSIGLTTLSDKLLLFSPDQQHIYKRIHFRDFLRSGQRSLEFVTDAGFWGCTVIAKTRLIASCPQILYSNVSFQKISRILPCYVFSFAIFVALYNPLKKFGLQSFPPSQKFQWLSLDGLFFTRCTVG